MRGKRLNGFGGSLIISIIGDVFHIMSTIAQTEKFLRDAFAGPGGSHEKIYKYAGDLTWLQVTEKVMLHENDVHESHWKPGPTHRQVKGRPENIGTKEYGAKSAWQVTNMAINKDGGAKRASTNADSYAQMMTAMY